MMTYLERAVKEENENHENSFYDVFDEEYTYEDLIDYKLKAGIPITGSELDF